MCCVSSLWARTHSLCTPTQLRHFVYWSHSRQRVLVQLAADGGLRRYSLLQYPYMEELLMSQLCVVSNTYSYRCLPLLSMLVLAMMITTSYHPRGSTRLSFSQVINSHCRVFQGMRRHEGIARPGYNRCARQSLCVTVLAKQSVLAMPTS